MVVVYKLKSWHAYEFILSNAKSEIPYNRETKCERKNLTLLILDFFKKERLCRDTPRL